MTASPDQTPEATARQMRALAHPLRVRLWSELGGGDAAISQLSTRLAVNKGSVSHHLKVLLGAHLVSRSHTRQVRGGTEVYYHRTLARLTFPADGREEPGPGAAMLQQMAEDVRSADEPHVHQRSIRLTHAQVAALTTHLDKVLHALQPADDRHPTYQVVAAVYRR